MKKGKETFTDDIETNILTILSKIEELNFDSLIGFKLQTVTAGKISFSWIIKSMSVWIGYWKKRFKLRLMWKIAATSAVKKANIQNILACHDFASDNLLSPWAVVLLQNSLMSRILGDSPPFSFSLLNNLHGCGWLLAYINKIEKIYFHYTLWGINQQLIIY